MSSEDRKILSLDELTAMWWEDRETNFIPNLVKHLEWEEADSKVLLEKATEPLALAFMAGAWAGGLSIHGTFLEQYDEFYREQFWERDLKRLKEGFWRLREWWRGVEYAHTPGARLIPEAVREALNARKLEEKCIRVSGKDPSQWVYTPDEAHAKGDRQIRMRPGKMLKKLLPDLSDHTIQAMATAFTQGTVGYPLQFATTRGDIRRVYVDGPNSCMSGDDFPASFHPAEAYAGPDTAVAFIEDFSGSITARAVVNQKNKTYARTYGNEVGLKEALGSAGYEREEEALDGCRLLRLLDGDNIICPYTDGMAEFQGDCKANLYIRDEGGEYLFVDGNTRMRYRTDTAVLSEGSPYSDDDDDQVFCACCDELGDEDDMTYVEDDGSVCEDCLDRHYVHAVVNDAPSRRRQTAWVSRNDATYVDALGEWVSDRVLNDGPDSLGIRYSDYQGDWISEDDAQFIESRSDYVDIHQVPVVETVGEVYELREDCVKLHDDRWALSDDCTELHDGRWALDDDVVPLSSHYSEKAGQYALESDVLPALGSDPEAREWVLDEEVIEYLAWDFYRKDCVRVEPTETHSARWVPLIAALRLDDGRYIEAQQDLPFTEETPAAQPAAEEEVLEGEPA